MSVTRTRPTVPEELPKLLHDLSYAVIKNNPRDIISFAADYFKQLHDEREGLTPAPEKIIYFEELDLYRSRGKPQTATAPFGVGEDEAECDVKSDQDLEE